MNEWTYEDKVFSPEDNDLDNVVGFVYLITDETNGKMYIGKKNFWRINKMPPLKGKKRKRHKKVPSDWQKYHGSSEEVKEMIEEHGYIIFKREILVLCKSKGAMNYVEMAEQIKRGVLLNPSKYYNAFIGGKIHRKHLTDLMDSDERVLL